MNGSVENPIVATTRGLLIVLPVADC